MGKLIIKIIFLSFLFLLSSCFYRNENETNVGTPRDETLVIDMLNGRIQNPKLFNPYQPGVGMDQGFNQLALDYLWEINTPSGEQFPSLAAEMPTPLNDEYTKFNIPLRQGIFWSDGVEFTAEDVKFTYDMLVNTPEFASSAFIKSVLKDVKIIDKYTVEMETFEPTPRFSKLMGVTIVGTTFKVVPKHIWENEDVTKFDNYPPVTLGQYKLKGVDINGYWFLWERREDWQRTSVGQVIDEMPSPKYVLYKAYGTEEKRLLAMSRNDLDILQDITPEGWEILKDVNPNVKAWYETFPYADMDDPCPRGITFNCSIPPYDDVRVRWALVLATDIVKVSFSTFAGMLRLAPLQAPPISVLMDVYHKPMLEWLNQFSFTDGYKPFDSNAGMRIAEQLRNEGVEGIPEDKDEIIDLFGIGWWKYDPAKAESLLIDAGFKRDNNGKWLLPNGKKWEMSITAPSNFEVQSQRVAFAAADMWREFGIDVFVRQVEAGEFWSAGSLGSFEAGAYWPASAIGPDMYETTRRWHKQYIVENGIAAPGNNERFSSDKISSILDELSKVTADDPENIELTFDLLKAFVEEMPWIQMFGTSKFVPVNETYWTNYPSAKNYYEGPWWWWSNFKYILPRIKPNQKVENNKTE